MIKKILSIAILAFTLAAPAQMNAQDIQRTPIEQEQKEVSIAVNDATLYIKNAEHLMVEIYNMTGVKVVSYRIDSNSKSIELNQLPKGCYIVKVGKVARKVYLR